VSGLLTNIISSDMSLVSTHVITSDTCHQFQRTSGLLTRQVSKTILRSREVLECLSFDLVLILEHSIFLRPTKFASLFIV